MTASASGSTTAATSATNDREGELSHRQILVILAGLMSAMFLSSLDQTVVSTAIRTIADDLQGLDAQAWVTTAYLMSATISTPLYGKLSDIYGRKPFFIIGIGIFVVGSLMCSFATSMYQLAVFRGVQGLGAGALMSLSMAIIGDIVPPRERAKYQGYILAVFATSSVAGPVVGGFFASLPEFLGVAGWRWVFLVNVPIGAIALFLVIVTLKVSNERVDHRIDWAGAAAIIVALVPILLVAEQGQVWGWTSLPAILCCVVGVVGVITFIVVERRAGDRALIPLRLFRDRTFAITIGGGVIVGMAMFGGMMTLPLYMQIVHGASPMHSGLMMLPLVVGMMTMSISSGLVISKTGKIRNIPIVGTVLLSIGMFLLSTIDAGTDLALVMTFMAVTGCGLGLCMQPLTLIVQNAVSPREMGVATSSATFFRQMGGTLGVAAFLSILFSRVGGKIDTELDAAAADGTLRTGLEAGLADEALHVSDPQAYDILEALANPEAGNEALESVTKDSSVIHRLPDLVAHPFEQGFALTMAEIYVVAGILAVIAAIILSFLPAIELRSGSGRAEAAREAAAANAAAAKDDEAGSDADAGPDADSDSDPESAGQGSGGAVTMGAGVAPAGVTPAGITAGSPPGRPVERREDGSSGPNADEERSY